MTYNVFFVLLHSVFKTTHRLSDVRALFEWRWTDKYLRDDILKKFHNIAM